MGSGWKAPQHAAPFHSPPLLRPSLSTRPLWWGCSPGTPGADWTLETPNLPARLFVRTEGKKKKGREQLCSWLHLPASVISIHCECKQTEPWKRKTWTEWRRERKKTGGGRKQSASKNILARCVRYKSPAHLLVSLADRNTHTLAGNTNMAHRHASSQRSLCGS